MKNIQNKKFGSLSEGNNYEQHSIYFIASLSLFGNSFGFPNVTGFIY
ncbi:hypothetical protein SAMN04489722_1014 [Algibacter lectus]|nr:hypothetical protein SAMN04489722_1014 [Algibacter lectus]